MGIVIILIVLFFFVEGHNKTFNSKKRIFDLILFVLIDKKYRAYWPYNNKNKIIYIGKIRSFF